MEAICDDCEKLTTVCTCGHDPDSCPSLFIDDQGWLRRCGQEPGHADPCHDDGEWAWSEDPTTGMPPIAETD